MKNLKSYLLSVLFLTAFCLTGVAQDSSYNDLPKSGWSITYQAPSKAWGIGTDIQIGYLVIDASYKSSDVPGYDSFETFTVGAGLNLRFWIGGKFFIGGQLGPELCLNQSKIEYKEYYTDVMFAGTKFEQKVERYNVHTKKENNTTWAVFFEPRIGFALTRSFALTAGYRFDFEEFDTKKKTDYLTAGINFLF